METSKGVAATAWSRLSGAGELVRSLCTHRMEFSAGLYVLSGYVHNPLKHISVNEKKWPIALHILSEGKRRN